MKKNITLCKILLILFLLFSGNFYKQMLWPFIPFDMYTAYNPRHLRTIRIKIIKEDGEITVISPVELTKKNIWNGDLVAAIIFFKKYRPEKFEEILVELKERAIIKYNDKHLRIIIVRKDFFYDNAEQTGHNAEVLGSL
jgi:hypothetical protein